MSNSGKISLDYTRHQGLINRKRTTSALPMMNSYEFDQPLDLRLKALNLSLSIYHQPHHHHNPHHHAHNNDHHQNHNVPNAAIMSGIVGSSICGSVGSNIGSSCSINTASGYGATNGPILSNNNNIPLHPTTVPFMSHHNQHQQQQPQHHSQIVTTHNQPQQRQHQSGSGLDLSRSPQEQQLHTNQHARNIHCQPLNHHQPHPLSRLNPASSHLQRVTLNPGHGQQQPPQPQLQHHSPPQQSAPAPQSQPQPPPSHQQHHHLQQQQLLPQRRQTSPQHYPYQPIKSLSISNHHMLSPIMSLSSTPKQVQFSQQPQSMSASSHSPGKSQSGGISHQQLLKFSAAVSQANGRSGGSCSPFTHDISCSSMLSTNSPNSIANNSSSNTVQSGVGARGNNNNGNNVNNSSNSSSDSDAAPTITRQHSLVSRYNCKPCGIVFSQPETLRAHQEGYCTKRDRTQTQVRSQSAVSPTVIQSQSTGANGSNSNSSK